MLALIKREIEDNLTFFLLAAIVAATFVLITVYSEVYTQTDTPSPGRGAFTRMTNQLAFFLLILLPLISVSSLFLPFFFSTFNPSSGPKVAVSRLR